ncbi:hypothetical protein [Caballeronia sp. LZ034LL]|uniref:hypothetical protein n=1 Tax=Caballeronia sp. LZ034LL TaxID=3038567 RepID=UPI00285F4CAE|nr:hypothetical protein [Caballeronia sp. LZ034LL]MDR5837451.1 hypothetical protein [Caballeronia sp. LZ034LL]
MAGALALACLALAAHAQQTCRPGDLGCAIFIGEHPLHAHLRDDNRALPSSTTRCVNCHAATPDAAASAAFAPPLTHDALLGETRRRGGPPSHYDAAAFCRALENGVDPAGVILRKAMPRYQPSDAECAALWRFVTSR